MLKKFHLENFFVKFVSFSVPPLFWLEVHPVVPPIHDYSDGSLLVAGGVGLGRPRGQRDRTEGEYVGRDVVWRIRSHRVGGVSGGS